MSRYCIAPEKLSSNLKFACGSDSTVAASDTVTTGLNEVYSAGATLNADPVDDPFLLTVAIPTQTGTAAGTITVKSWKNTGGTDPTPAAATTFSKAYSWWAVGR